MPSLKYKGCQLYRQRIVASALSGNSLKIEGIREEDEITPGLQDFEASFLRLIEKMVDGCRIEINETGTTLRIKPGLLTGGRITHDCGTSRSIGWFIEGIIPLAIFCKSAVHLTLTGITNDATDLSVDILRNVTLPLLRNFGIEGASLTVKRRGAFPKGGGLVEFACPVVRDLRPINITDEGLISRIRGVAFCARVSPTIVTRVVDSARSVLNNLLPDVYIHTDHYRGSDGGNSAGYSLSLVAESTTGVLLSVERTAGGPNAQGMELPEDIGSEGARMLLDEIRRGGVVDSSHQPLVLQLMVMGPEDVCKVRFGQLTEASVRTLRLLRDAFGVVFKIKQDVSESGSRTVILTCLGTGYKNMSRKIAS